MKKILFFVTLIIGFTSQAQDISSHYKIYDTKLKKITDLNSIVHSMDDAQILFFGEEHNDSIGHYLEATILELLAKKFSNKVTLTMEMFHRDVQTVINEYLNGQISEKNFIKEARAWNNYQDYKPMIELAKLQKFSVVGGNAAARYSNLVTMKGLSALSGFSKNSLQNFAPLPIDTATGRYFDKFIETLGGHSMGSMQIYQTQNFWDATMAWSIVNAWKKNPKFKIFQVNGRFHSDEKLGTYAKLMKYAPAVKALNISCFSADDFANPNWENYQQLGDYIIVTDPTVKKTF